MSDNTHIEWADATLNYVNGCSLASPGCTNCYAMRLAGTRLKHHPSREGLTVDTKAGPVWTGEVRCHELALIQALKWKRPRRIFWNAHGDLFHDNVSDAWIDRLFAVCALTPQHTHMILTKQAGRMREYMTAIETRPEQFGAALAEVVMSGGMSREHGLDAIEAMAWPLPNVWLGVSVEDQIRADERIPDLLATPAAVRFLSCEPLLGPIDLLKWFDPTGACCGGEPEYRCDNCPSDASWRYSIAAEDGTWAFDPTIDWVIVGGESGPRARPMHPDWPRELRDQCLGNEVPFHFKQWGEWSPCEAVANANGGVDLVPPVSFRAVHRWRRWEGDTTRNAREDESAGEFLAPGILAIPDGKKRAGRLLDGVEHNGMPGMQP